MKNKCTLLIDGNWLLQSRFAVLSNGFVKDNPEIAKEQSSQELKELLARSINVILNRFECIDNIILISDGGSWRKQLPIPESLVGTTYKGNRSQDSDIDWNYIYKALNKLVNHCKKIGITTSCHSNVEGDDWIWYWSRRLNAEGTHCIIWSSDNDLKQLIQVDKNTGAFTSWYNDRNGLWLHKDLQDDMESEEDIMNFFMKPEYHSPILESLRKKSKQVSYIWPQNIILQKIICGDSGDNIKSVFRYEKNGRIYRITEKDWTTINEECDNISSMEKFMENVDNIAKHISNYKKFKSYSPVYENIKEMIRYNIKLVWLNEKVIPETIIMVMNQQEYKLYDIPYIRSNFRILLDDNDVDIKKIFEDF